MDLASRLALVVVLVAVGAAVTLAYRRRRRLDDQQGAHDVETGTRRWPDLPAELRSGADWIIFTTPYCVSCGAVRGDLEQHDPSRAVRTVDATERPDLADRYGVQRAPTTILADEHGHVVERLVGPEAVRDYLRDRDPERDRRSLRA